MNAKGIFVIAGEESFEFYRAIPIWEQRLEFHPLDGDTPSVVRGNPELVVIDCGFDERRGLSLLHEWKTSCPEVPVFLITDAGSEETAVAAFRLGARNYFKKPVDLINLKEEIEKVQKFTRISQEKRTPLDICTLMEKERYSLSLTDDVPANLLRVISYIGRHFSEPLTIDHLAGEAGISRFHFCRLFKKSTGMSPMKFVAMMRVERGKALIRKNIPIIAVALKVGFSNPGNFIRHFKSFTGLTPTAYRNSQQMQRPIPPR